jgi:hypothetical protein
MTSSRCRPSVSSIVAAIRSSNVRNSGGASFDPALLPSTL